MKSDMDYCLAIAAAFIAIIAACAALISSANNKADSLANRIRGAAKEYRECSNGLRRQQLREQMDLFNPRFDRIQRSQKHLLHAVGSFIGSLVILICVGLYLLAGGTPDPSAFSVLIGMFITFGAVCMLWSIHLQVSEVSETNRTLKIETRDCVDCDEANPVDASRVPKLELEARNGATDDLAYLVIWRARINYLRALRYVAAGFAFIAIVATMDSHYFLNLVSWLASKGLVNPSLGWIRSATSVLAVGGGLFLAISIIASIVSFRYMKEARKLGELNESIS